MKAADSDIRFETVGRLGLVTLDRAQALNAITHEMMLALAAQLDEWEADEQVAAVAVRAVPGPAFSSGGDLRHLYEAGLKAKRGEGALPVPFFRAEYRLNHRVHTYPKPYVSLIDGIVMGGGAGISINGRYRIAGPNIRFAMPEVGIGFFPDVGATWLLPRLPGFVGTYLALTGTQLGQADCLWAGIATHAAAAEDFDTILDGLAAGEAVEAACARASRRGADRGEAESTASALAAEQDRIDSVFGQDSLELVLSSLDIAQWERWERGEKALRAMERAAPTSLAIALRQMREGPRLDFAAAMQTEYRIVNRVLEGDDFYEGIRAQVIDKDRRPRWNPALLSQLDPASVDVFFAPLEVELDL